MWKGETYHFCDCPTHRNRLKWHNHTVEECRTRIRWLKKIATDSTSQEPLDANLGVNADDPAENTMDGDTTSDPTADSNNIQALLASAMNLVTGNDVLRDHIAEALNASAGI